MYSHIQILFPVAHSEVYGYGFRAYEYLRAPGSENASIAEDQQMELGMYSMRSFLYPRIFMLLFHVKEWLGIQQKPFLVRIHQVSISCQGTESLSLVVNF